MERHEFLKVHFCIVIQRGITVRYFFTPLFPYMIYFISLDFSVDKY